MKQFNNAAIFLVLLLMIVSIYDFANFPIDRNILPLTTLLNGNVAHLFLVTPLSNGWSFTGAAKLSSGNVYFGGGCNCTGGTATREYQVTASSLINFSYTIGLIGYGGTSRVRIQVFESSTNAILYDSNKTIGTYTFSIMSPIDGIIKIVFTDTSFGNMASQDTQILSFSIVDTATPSPTNTPTFTDTPSETPTLLPTFTDTPSETSTLLPTPTETSTSSPTATETPSETPTLTPTDTLLPTLTSTDTLLPTLTSTIVPSTDTPQPTNTQTLGTSVATAIVTDTPVPPTSTDTPVLLPTITDTFTPIPTDTSVPITSTDTTTPTSTQNINTPTFDELVQAAVVATLQALGCATP